MLLAVFLTPSLPLSLLSQKKGALGSAGHSLFESELLTEKTQIVKKNNNNNKIG